MSDKARRAIAYALRRVIDDKNFRHYMLDTEALRLLMEAEAEVRGVSVSAVGSWLQDAIMKVGKQQGKPDVVELRERIDELETGEEDREYEDFLRREEQRKREELAELFDFMRWRGKFGIDHLEATREVSNAAD